MRPGPSKRFDPDEAVENARDLFWRRGFDGTGIRELEAELGIGRKSLYDTFGSKRELYLRAIRLYADTVIAKIRRRLDDPEAPAIASLQRALQRLAQHHGSDESVGCLLGVAMGQSTRDEPDVAGAVGEALRGLEDAFERNLRRAQVDGDVRADVVPRDAARNLVALTQGMALLGRIAASGAQTRSVVRAALLALRA